MTALPWPSNCDLRSAALPSARRADAPLLNCTGPTDELNIRSRTGWRSLLICAPSSPHVYETASPVAPRLWLSTLRRTYSLPPPPTTLLVLLPTRFQVGSIQHALLALSQATPFFTPRSFRSPYASVVSTGLEDLSRLPGPSLSFETMRSSALIAASLASNALAVPMLNKRGVVVTDLDIVTVTKYVTATGPCPTTGVTNTVAVTQEAVTSSMVEVTSYTSAAAVETTPAVVVPAPVSSVVAGLTSVVESVSSAVESVATSIYVAPSSSPAPVTTAEPTYAPVTSETPSPSTTAAATTSSAAGGFSTYSFCPTTSVESTASLTAQPTGTVQKKWLAYHNAHRANHTDGCSMYWDYDLEAKAQDSANTCVYEHTVSSTDNFGQNMGQFEYTTSGLGTVNDTTMENSPAFFSNMYYEEYNDFGPYWGSSSVPTEGPNILHFTQMVWKNSFSVGCATAKCSNDQQMITFCNYRSRGNILDEYGTNVALFIDSPHKPLCAEINSDATDGSCITDAELGI